MIELKHITKVYDNNYRALDDINLTIRDGEIFGIIGQSGAGKSTLVRCINMLEPPSSGEVIINGKDITKLSSSELRKERKNIGMIFQHFNLLSNRTVAQNVAFPLELANVPKADQLQGQVSVPAFRRTEAESRHCKSRRIQPLCTAFG